METVRHSGKLDVLINNASSYYPTEVGQINENNWQDLIGSNLESAHVSDQAAAPERHAKIMAALSTLSTCMLSARKRLHRVQRGKSRPGDTDQVFSTRTQPGSTRKCGAPGPVQWPADNPQFDEV